MHNLLNRRDDLANQIITAIQIDINDGKLQLLFSFKEVIQGETALEIWIQIILYLLGLTEFNPFLIAIIIFREDAEGI